MFDSFFDALKFTPKRTFKQWLFEEYVLPDGQHGQKLFSINDHYWMLPIIDIINSEQYFEYYLNAIPQIGKSTLGAGYIMWRLFEHGESVQVLLPDQNLSTGFYKEKMERTIYENPRLKKLLPPTYQSNESHKDVIRFQNGGILRNIFSFRNIRMHTAASLLCSEAAQFRGISATEGDVITLAQRRQSIYPHLGLQFYESTPTIDTVKFHKMVPLGTNSHLEVRCPYCKEYINAGERDNFKWNKEKPFIECVKCKHEIFEEHRKDMLKDIILVHKKPDATKFSVTVDWFYSNTTFDDLKEVEKNNDESPDLDSLRKLLQNYYGMPVTTEDEKKNMPNAYATTYSEKAIMERINPTYIRGQLPEGTIFTTAAIDIQKAWCYYIILAIDKECGIWIVDWDNSPFVPYELQEQITATPQMVINGLEVAYQNIMKYNPLNIAVDVGYTHESTDTPIVRNWVQSHTPKTIACVGRDQYQFAKVKKDEYEMLSAVADYLKITKQEDGSLLYLIDVNKVKTLFRDRLLYPVGASGGVRFPRDLQDPNKRREYLIKHLMAETPNIITTRFGQQLIKWTPVKGTKRNDLFDCLTYALCLGLFHAAGNDISTMPIPTPRIIAKEAKERDKKPQMRRIVKRGAYGF